MSMTGSNPTYNFFYFLFSKLRIKSSVICLPYLQDLDARLTWSWILERALIQFIIEISTTRVTLTKVFWTTEQRGEGSSSTSSRSSSSRSSSTSRCSSKSGSENFSCRRKTSQAHFLFSNVSAFNRLWSGDPGPSGLLLNQQTCLKDKWTQLMISYFYFYAIFTCNRLHLVLGR